MCKYTIPSFNRFGSEKCRWTAIIACFFNWRKTQVVSSLLEGKKEIKKVRVLFALIKFPIMVCQKTIIIYSSLVFEINALITNVNKSRIAGLELKRVSEPISEHEKSSKCWRTHNAPECFKPWWTIIQLGYVRRKNKFLSKKLLKVLLTGWRCLLV